MARQNSIIPFTGKLGNLIGYQRNGKYFLRSMPELVRQTLGTRRAAHRFGIASRRGALIRNAFYNDLDIRCDSDHVNRLNKTLIAAAGNSMAIKGFRFNQYAGTDRFFTIAPRLSSNGILHIPAQTLQNIKAITALDIKVIAARIDFTTHKIINTDAVLITIDTNGPFTGVNIEPDLPGNGTLVVTLQVRAVYNDGPSANRQHLAADIIGVIPPQTHRKLTKHIYPQRAISGPQNSLHHAYTKYQPFIQRE